MSRMSIVTKTEKRDRTVPMDYTAAGEIPGIPAQQVDQKAYHSLEKLPVTPDKLVQESEEAVATAIAHAANGFLACTPRERDDKIFLVYDWLYAQAGPVDESMVSASVPHAYLQCPGRCCPVSAEESSDQEPERQAAFGENLPSAQPGCPMGAKDIKDFAGAVWESIRRAINLLSTKSSLQNDAFQHLLDDVLLNATLVCPEEDTSLPWHCLLEGLKPVELCCERPPWSTNGEGCFTVLPRYVEHRVEERACASDARRNRDRLWASMQFAVSGNVSEERIFVGAGRRHSYTLRPTPRSCVPLQWVHRSAFAISNGLANLACTWLSEDMLLSLFSDIVGIPCAWQSEGMRQCFHHVRRTVRDFGEAYGILRPHFRWIQENHLTVDAIPFEDIVLWCQKKNGCWIYPYEADAIDGEPDTRPQPRHVWDLYSNRVLPFHLACPAGYSLGSPWLVTELRGSAPRELVKTRVNGEQWRVSVPRGTSLEHVGVELLNMGAEYVWLAELCMPLRRRDATGSPDLAAARPDVEAMARLLEREAATHVLYPCGLGAPTSLLSLGSAYDALRTLRGVWAYEKKWGCWLPGGLVPTAAHEVTAARLLFDEEIRRDEVISSRVVQAMNVVPAVLEMLRPPPTLEAFGFVPDEFLRD